MSNEFDDKGAIREKRWQDDTNRHISKDVWVPVVAKAMAIWAPPSGSLFGRIFSFRHNEYEISQKKVELVKKLIESGIEPAAFYKLISNEINRRLKTRFGIAFLALTTFFTAASYMIVVLNGVYQWNISQVAITALIIEAPIQFIGLLYIIARNLFPQRNETPVLSRVFGDGRNSRQGEEGTVQTEVMPS